MWLDILKSFLSIALELTILFAVISFIVQLLQGLIPYDKMEKWMAGTHPLISAFMALAFAFITPFCSCSTIPIVVHLLHRKVRFSLVMIFLFASPILDPTIITLMGATMGFKVAFAYTLITSILSLAIGFLLEFLGFEKQVKKVIMLGKRPNKKTFDFQGAIAETIRMMKSFYPFLILGAAIGAVIKGAVPTEWITTYMGGESWWLVPVAAIIGIPLYIRLSTMIPISQILMAKGMALGPMMALMISSAGASLPEITMLHSIFKKRLVFAFVGSVIMMSTLSGLLFYLII